MATVLELHAPGKVATLQPGARSLWRHSYAAAARRGRHGVRANRILRLRVRAAMCQRVARAHRAPRSRAGARRHVADDAPGGVLGRFLAGGRPQAGAGAGSIAADGGAHQRWFRRPTAVGVVRRLTPRVEWGLSTESSRDVNRRIERSYARPRGQGPSAADAATKSGTRGQSSRKHQQRASRVV